MNTVLLDSVSVTPSKVVCVGRNYVEHIQELANEVPAEPVLFNKPNSAISVDLFFNADEPVHYEGEIAFIIENGQYTGVGFGLDLTKREVQSVLKSNGFPWERAKAFDGSAVFSPFVRFDGGVNKLHLKLLINGVVVQQGRVEQMIFKPDVLLSEIKALFSLEDGDIIMSGTPKGVGVISRGDSFVAQLYDGDTLLVEQQWQVK